MIDWHGERITISNFNDGFKNVGHCSYGIPCLRTYCTCGHPIQTKPNMVRMGRSTVLKYNLNRKYGLKNRINKNQNQRNP